jgi:predicted RNA binding protein YcfA (HicA-like mRNA interferase family)
VKLPRDLSAADLVRALARNGYEITRQTGSHIRLTTSVGGGHHITIPNHDPIKIGTLNGILREVGSHAGLGREELLHKLFSS